jgi:hypothetical protein
VVDVLADRSAETTARWLQQHPEIEVVSRDRCGLYAQAGVPAASLQKFTLAYCTQCQPPGLAPHFPVTLLPAPYRKVTETRGLMHEPYRIWKSCTISRVSTVTCGEMAWKAHK